MRHHTSKPDQWTSPRWRDPATRGPIAPMSEVDATAWRLTRERHPERYRQAMPQTERKGIMSWLRK